MLTYQQKKLSITCVTVLAILGLLYGSAFVIFKTYFTANHVQELIITQAEKVLNRDVSVSNDITFKIDWDLSPHITLHDVVISNATWAKHPNMVKVKELDVHFSLTKLIFKEFHIISILLREPEVYLETNGNKKNWDLGNKNANEGSNIKFSINKIKVLQGNVVYNDDNYIIDKFDLKIQDDQTYFHVHLIGKRNKLPLKATINIEKTREKTLFDVDNLQLGTSILKGNLSITNSPQSILGDFEANVISLQDFSSSEAAANGEYTISDNILPINNLNNAAFKLRVKVNKLDLDGIILNKVNLLAQSNKNVLNFKLSPAAKFANGSLDFNLSYDLNNRNPQIKIQAKTNGLTLQGLLDNLYGKSPINGSDFKFNADLSSSGNNLKSIVGNLNGKILITAGPGTFLNGSASIGNIISNVLTSIISFDKTKSSTSFNCGVLNFKVNNGVANAKNAVGIEAASVNILGNGMIDLRNGRINFSITPQNLITNPLELANFSLAQYVSITGTMSKPQVTLDPTKMINSQSALVAQIATGVAGGGIPILAGILAGGAINATAKPQQNLSPCKAAMAN